MGDIKNTHKIFVVKPEGKIPLGRRRPVDVWLI
jgi:hypothetical protein